MVDVTDLRCGDPAGGRPDARSKSNRRCLRVLSAILVLGALGGSGDAGESAPDWVAVSKEAVDLLQRYVRIKSVNPPASTAETAELLRQVLTQEGIEVRTFEAAPGKVNLLARLPATTSGDARRGSVLLLQHMDVVPADASHWPVDPFAGEVKDGHLYGRGALDMKGLGVIHLLSMLLLERQDVPRSRDVLLLATADEETGGKDGAGWMVEHQWPSLGPEFVFDEGGFGSRNVLTDDGRLVFGVSMAEKKILWLKVVAEGAAGHASQPTPDNANATLLRALGKILARDTRQHLTPVTAELQKRLGRLADNKFVRAILSDTVSLTTLRSGVGDPPKVNVIPGTAEATLDCRLLPDTDVDAFVADLTALLSCEPRVRLETMIRLDQTPASPIRTAAFDAIERAVAKEHAGAIVTPMLIPYGSDSNKFRVKGATAYGLTPMVLDASILATMHGDAERIPVDELGRGVRLFYEILVDLCAPRSR
jgi:acetylornithine deacetylase/succinyl-diaminopimelate desuccinylase-like protein